MEPAGSILIYPWKTCPPNTSEQILALLYREWPHTFSADGIEGPPAYPAGGLVSVVLLIQDMVVSHASVPRAEYNYHGKKMIVCGVSSMVTHPDYRGRGHGKAVLKAATDYMETSGAGMGVFTCDPPLLPFYKRFGWRVVSPGVFLVGGTEEHPFSSAELGKLTLMRYFSAGAVSRLLETGPLFLNLGEKKLW